MDDSVLRWIVIVAALVVILTAAEIRRAGKRSSDDCCRHQPVIGFMRESDIIFIPGDVTDGSGDDYCDF